MKVVTGVLLAKAFPNTPQETLGAVALELLSQAPSFGLNTPQRLAAFIAEAGHESGGFMRMTENLNYGAPGLLATFSTHFTPAQATAYARQPERIANKAYENRMGNGPEASGDGWKFRGRGWFQLTGKDNYIAFAAACGKSLDDTITYLQSIKGACHSAMWYWQNRSLTALADKGQIDAISEKINGGKIGLEERHDLYTKLNTLLT